MTARPAARPPSGRAAQLTGRRAAEPPGRRAAGKTLGIDARRLLGYRTGIARYVQCLLAEWQRMELPFDEVRLFSPRPLPADAVPDDPRFRNVVLAPELPGLAWEQLRLPLGARGVDVLFSPADTLPVLRRGRRVVINQAYSPEMAASFGRWERAKRLPFLRYAACHADLFLSPCEAILRSTEAGLGVAIERERVRLTPLAAEQRFRPIDHADPRALDVRRRYGVSDRPYVLFVGKLSRRRHIPELIEAFGDLRDRLPHALVLAGPNHLGLDVRGLVHRLGLDGRVIHEGFVPDADLPWLYGGADLFVLASEGEGYSLTTLEAMQSGVPVITLDRPSLVEVTAGAALLIPDGTRESLRAAMAELLADPGARAELRRRGLERTRELTWARTARATMDALWEAAAR